MSGDKKDDFEVEYIPASDDLKIKAPLIDKNLNDALEKASQALSEMASDYIVWAQDDYNRLSQTASELATDPDSKTSIDAVHRIAHDMKGQGGTFGYPLITLVLNNLCLYLDARQKVDADDLKIINLHIEFVNVIISNRLKEKGGEMGEQVIEGMRKIVMKKIK